MVVHYLKWTPDGNPFCHDPSGRFTVYCHPKEFKTTTNTLYHNLSGGKFEDVSAANGIRKEAGKGMGIAVADYDGDGYPDVFITNDTIPNFLFHNQRNGTFSEVAFAAGVAFPTTAMRSPAWVPIFAITTTTVFRILFLPRCKARHFLSLGIWAKENSAPPMPAV